MPTISHEAIEAEAEYTSGLEAENHSYCDELAETKIEIAKVKIEIAKVKAENAAVRAENTRLMSDRSLAV